MDAIPLRFIQTRNVDYTGANLLEFCQGSRLVAEVGGCEIFMGTSDSYDEDEIHGERLVVGGEPGRKMSDSLWGGLEIGENENGKGTGWFERIKFLDGQEGALEWRHGGGGGEIVTEVLEEERGGWYYSYLCLGIGPVDLWCRWGSAVHEMSSSLRFRKQPITAEYIFQVTVCSDNRNSLNHCSTM